MRVSIFARSSFVYYPCSELNNIKRRPVARFRFAPNNSNWYISDRLLKTVYVRRIRRRKNDILLFYFIFAPPLFGAGIRSDVKTFRYRHAIVVYHDYTWQWQCQCKRASVFFYYLPRRCKKCPIRQINAYDDVHRTYTGTEYYYYYTAVTVYTWIYHQWPEPIYRLGRCCTFVLIL